jgi:hypothetical protein
LVGAGDSRLHLNLQRNLRILLMDTTTTAHVTALPIDALFVLDIETTGLDPRTSVLCEVACVVWDISHDQLITTMDLRCRVAADRFMRECSYRVLKTHRDSGLLAACSNGSDAYDETDVLRRLLHLMENPPANIASMTIAGANAAMVSVPYLKARAAALGLQWPKGATSHPVLDLGSMAAGYLRHPLPLQSDDAFQTLGIRTEGQRHRALTNARMTLQAVRKMAALPNR